MNKIKYLCDKCKSPKLPKIELELSNEPGTAPVEKEIIRTLINKSRPEKPFIGRQLECNHFIPMHIMGFTDSSSENLNEQEIAIIRSTINKTMIGKSAKDYEFAILFQVEQYQTLLKLASKQRMQAKYAIQLLDQLREKYSQSLSSEERQTLDMKFAHFLDQRPISNKIIERELNQSERDANKQKAALKAGLEAFKAMAKKTGYDPKELIKKEENKKE